ncbi:MAG: hypothetical protein NT076_02230 [Candidatus Pacearchaeota archaeon]|nr:hypothetical protein [Candidatus Pacearchaeota archaeon]
MSNEQRWDQAIESLCEKINLKKEYYTTSSCAGRIVLIKALKEKAEDVFLFKTHEKISFSQLKKALASVKYKGLIYFKQETCILHVACKDLEGAVELLNKAKFAGWKRSGIIASGKRTICELMSTEKLELPITNDCKLLVDEDYLKLLVKEANSRLERVWEKIEKLDELI